MITDAEMYRKSLRVLAGLESRIKAGAATDAELERARVILDHVLVWEWSQDGRPAEPLMPPLPTPLRDPRARAFADWWDRVRSRAAWADRDWCAGLVFWTRQARLPGAELMALSDDVEDELRERAEQARAA